MARSTHRRTLTLCCSGLLLAACPTLGGRSDADAGPADTGSSDASATADASAASWDTGATPADDAGAPPHADAGGKADASPSPFTIPANQWVLIDEDQTGVRSGALMRLQADGKVTLASQTVDRGAEPEGNPRSKVMTFDLGLRQWETTTTAFTTALQADVPLAFSADSAYAFAKSYGVMTHLERIDLATLAATTVGDEAWMADISPTYRQFRDYGDPFSMLDSANLVWDPVHSEVLLLGGYSGGGRKGALGNWAFSPQTSAWRPLASGTETARTLFTDLDEAANDVRLVVLRGRAAWHRGLSDTALAQKVHDEIAPAWTNLGTVLSALKTRVHALDASSGLEADSIARGQQLIDAAHAGFLTGLTAFNTSSAFGGALLTALDRVALQLREAAWALAPEPPPRAGAAVAVLGDGLVLFGGTHGDFATADTWLYDFASRRWRQIWPERSPSPRFGSRFVGFAETGHAVLISGQTFRRRIEPQSPDEKVPTEAWLFDRDTLKWSFVTTLDAASEPSVMRLVAAAPVGGETLLVVGNGKSEYASIQRSSTWALRVDASALDPAPTTSKGVPAGTSLSRADAFNGWSPAWYDEAPRDPPGTFEAWIDALPVNTWTEIPARERNNTARSWGRTIFDAPNHQLLHWTGGHQSDPTNAVQHLHIDTGRWSIGHVSESGWANTFNGRPDCLNHNYIAIALDPVSGLLVAPHRAGTHLYDPALGDWVDYTTTQPFFYELYSVKLAPTPTGVVAWTGGPVAGGYFGRFNPTSRAWEPLPVASGQVAPITGADENGFVYDSKRDRLLFFAAESYENPGGQVWAYDFTSQAFTALDPVNKAFVDAAGPETTLHRTRETVYLPELDLVLFGMIWVGGKQVGYDVANNRWVTTDLAAHSDSHFGSVDCGLAYDSDRQRLYSLCNYGQGFVLRFSPSAVTTTLLQ
ncbi:MAG: kelch repeat-containing protein [Myxococcales bacterium]